MFYDIYVSSDTTKGSIECVSINRVFVLSGLNYEENEKM